MNKKSKAISLSLVAALCVSLACMTVSTAKFSSLSKASVNAIVKAGTDEEAILNYVKVNKLTAKKTNSGLYYVIQEQGKGDKVAAGKKVTVNYTGKLLNGTKFDSSTDPAFGHVQPLPLTVGVGQVIKGWDEGLQLFNVGGKGILLIPSALAYGSQAMGDKIPANSVLVFDVEIVSQDK